MNEIAGMLVSALGQGFIYAPMALGVFLTFSILKTPDLTVEGSFVFGMTACVVVTIAGHPILGLVAGTLAGAAAGLCTGLLQTKLKIEPILSGILTMTGLYTVNYAILGGQSNRYLQYEAKNSLGVTVNKPADTVYKIFQRAFVIRHDRIFTYHDNRYCNLCSSCYIFPYKKWYGDYCNW